MARNIVDRGSCLALLMIMWTGNVFASTTYFANEADFLNAVSNPSMESFESLPATNIKGFVPIVTSQLTVTPGTNSDIGVWDNTDDGPHPTDGVNFIRMDTDTGPGTTLMIISFLTPVSAFAFDITDFGDYNGGLSLIFSNDVGDTQTIVSGVFPNGNEQFFGMMNTASDFQTVTILNQNEIDGTGFDKIYFKPSVQPVPLPAAFWFFMSGLLAMCRYGSAFHIRRK